MDRCFHQLFEAQVGRTRDAVAVVFERQRLTYHDLNSRANQLGHRLRALGVGPEALVGICVERSLEMMVGLLGILKAGGAYVPLDPTYPPKRLAFMLADAGPSVVVTQQRLLKQLPEQRAQIVCLDADREAIERESEANPVSSVTPQNLAYVIYTSGSTGTPKGVMIPHQGLVNYLCWAAKAYGVAEGRGALVHSPLGFDLTITSLFCPLLVGQRVVLVPEENELEALATALRTGGDFSLVKITPAHLRALSQMLPPDAAAGRARALIIGGEALSWESLAFWQQHAPDTRLINEYGPTETVVGCCTYEAPAGAPRSGAVPIGRPIARTQLYVLDDHLQPVPAGVPGELCIGGDGVGRGYLNQPELTAERFIPDPFRNRPGARLYRTGDQARCLPDGNLAFLGRLDHQVKIRGFRIELAEIEAALAQHPAVKESRVVVREDLAGDRRLVAYVIPHSQQMPAWDEIRRFLREKLPEYMVPTAYVRLEAFPLTPNGKVDRQALPAPDYGRAERARSFVAPRDPLELRLAELWEKVLEVRPIGVRDSFFDLGGQSLLAVRLFAEVEKAYGIHLPLVTLFHAPTVEQLGTALRQKGWSYPYTSLVPIQPNGHRPPLFLVNGVGGHILCYRNLSPHLGANQPVYGLYGLRLEALEGPSGIRVEDMAAHYSTELRALQPSGPYFIGGFSFGALVAFELARQLHAQGQQVALLALFDSEAPGYSERRRVLPALRSRLETLLRLEASMKLPYLLAGGKGADETSREQSSRAAARASRERRAALAACASARPGD